MSEIDWSKFDRCTTKGCHAPAGKPCHDARMPSFAEAPIRRPHRGRPTVPPDTFGYVVLTKQLNGSWRDDWDGEVHLWPSDAHAALAEAVETCGGRGSEARPPRLRAHRMSDETRAVPTSADIEAIRQRDASAPHYTSDWSRKDTHACRMDRLDLLAALDGERRHRADLERQLEDTARALVLFGGHRVTCEYAERCTCGFDVARDEAARCLARQVVQEAETLMAQYPASRPVEEAGTP